MLCSGGRRQRSGGVGARGAHQLRARRGLLGQRTSSRGAHSPLRRFHAGAPTQPTEARTQSYYFKLIIITKILSMMLLKLLQGSKDEERPIFKF